MAKSYEHLALDISPHALEHLEAAIQQYRESGQLSAPLDLELFNLENECRARLQHVVAGMPDISQGATVPSRSAEEGWLDE